MPKTNDKNTQFKVWARFISDKNKEQTAQDVALAVALMAVMWDMTEEQGLRLLDEFATYYQRNA